MGVISATILKPGDQWKSLPGFDSKAFVAAIDNVAAVKGREAGLGKGKLSELKDRHAWMKELSDAVGALVKAANKAATDLNALAKKATGADADRLSAAASNASSILAEAGAEYKSLQ